MNIPITDGSRRVEMAPVMRIRTRVAILRLDDADRQQSIRSNADSPGVTHIAVKPKSCGKAHKQ